MKDGQLLGRKPWTVVYPDDTDITKRLNKLEDDLSASKIEHTSQINSIKIEHGKELVELNIDIKNLKKTIEEDAKIFGREFLQNTATQILLFAIREQPKPSSTATYFRSRKTTCPELTTFVTAANAANPDAVVSYTETGLASTFDKIITRRNSTLHYSDRHSLESKAVTVARELLARHPVLRATCAQETFVIDFYEKILSAFGF